MRSGMMLSHLRVCFFVLLSVALLPYAFPAEPASIRIVDLRCEYKVNPLGIESPAPRLSWRLEGSGRGIAQTAYQIRVAESESALRAGKPLLWDSSEIHSSDSVQVPYRGPALQSGHRYYWQVRIWNNHGATSAWSAPGNWEIGLLQSADWQASWIEPDLPNDVVGGPAPLLRREVDLSHGILRARLYVTSHGLYELHMNGRRVGDQLFTPGWTSYNHRLQYQTYDVTDLLKSGRNAIGATLGSGWYRYQGRHIYGDHLALLLQLHVTYGHGREQIIGTDSNWKSSTDAIVMSEIYNGETYAARLEKADWTQPGFRDAGWSAVRVANHPKDNLVAPAGPPVRRIQELKPVKI